MPPWNYKLKQRNTTIDLLGELKFKTPPNGDKDDLLQGLTLIAGRDAKWYSHLGRLFGSF